MVWHVTWIDEEDGKFIARCIPHGPLGVCTTHYAAILCGYQHDFDIRGDLTMPGYSPNDLKEAGW